MKSLRIVFVANNKNSASYLADPAFIYRCENLALALQKAGHETELIHISQLSVIRNMDILVLHRPKKHWFTHFQLALLRRRGTKIIADFDDLVFLPQYAFCSPGVINQLVSEQQTRKNFAKHQAALNYCDAAIVSVAPLQAKMQQNYTLPCLILPNAVHQSWYNFLEAPDRLKQARLTYFPGTHSHDRDFAMIKPVLEQLLDEEPELVLHITGVLETDLSCRPKQLQYHAKQPFAGYAQHVAQSWVNLAPLQATEFNQHKSALKAIEASWFNAPTLASPIPDMERLQDAGAWLMHHDSDWYTAIKALLTSAFYQQKQTDLRQKIIKQANANINAQKFIEFTAAL